MSLVKIKPARHVTPAPIAGMMTAPFHMCLPKAAIGKLEKVIQSGTETDAHNLFLTYPALLSFLMTTTGHHGTWYSNKPQFRPKLTNGKSGKIPDFLIAGRNSHGLSWHILELKSPNEALFNTRGDAFSYVANKGLNQLALYLKFSVENQGYIRDSLEIHDFNTPRGILVIGKEAETYANVKGELKAFWNSCLHHIEIISYSRILECAKEVVKMRG